MPPRFLFVKSLFTSSVRPSGARYVCFRVSTIARPRRKPAGFPTPITLLLADGGVGSRRLMTEGHPGGPPLARPAALSPTRALCSARLTWRRGGIGVTLCRLLSSPSSSELTSDYRCVSFMASRHSQRLIPICRPLRSSREHPNHMLGQ